MSKRIDGKEIAREIESRIAQEFARLRERGVVPTLEILSFGNDPATQSFLRIKKRVAQRVGVSMNIRELPLETLPHLAENILNSIVASSPHGVVVQLPLPEHFVKSDFLRNIPPHLDVDCISETSLMKFSQGDPVFVPPVALAVEEILNRHCEHLSDMRVAIVGFGDLVGKPVSFLVQSRGVDFTVFDSSSDISKLKEYDVVVSGVGKPGIIKGDHIQEGAILIDAGTSEEAGILSGDVHVSAQEKASLFTPVPGGVGPITVVTLFENVLKSASGL